MEEDAGLLLYGLLIINLFPKDATHSTNQCILVAVNCMSMLV